MNLRICEWNSLSLTSSLSLSYPTVAIDLTSMRQSKQACTFLADFSVPDIKILDIKMPKMNGVELYEKMKNIDDKIKVCFLTVFGEGYHEDFKRRFQGEQINSSATLVFSLRKPITVDDLVKKVNEII